MKYSLVVIVLTLSFGASCEKCEALSKDDATILDHPYTVSIQTLVYNNMLHVVGGAIISGNTVISVAHYFVDYADNGYFIRAGSEITTAGGQWKEVISIILHPSFNVNTLEYNVALLKVSHPFLLGTILPIAMASSGLMPAENTTGVVSGWKVDYEIREKSEPLQAVVVPVIDSSTCIDIYAGSGVITLSMFCAGNLNVRTDENCIPYSGFPFVVKNTLFGIYSWGFQCNYPSYPGVYINIGSVRTWINNNL